MKRIFTLSIFFFASVFFLSSCVKNNIPSNDESYWLSKDQGEVVYSDSYCNYFVVETLNGFTIIRASGSYKPYEGNVVYGNFSNQGTREMYNYSSRVVFTGTITDYWLSYVEAQDALDYYCPVYGRTEGVAKREFKKATTLKK